MSVFVEEQKPLWFEEALGLSFILFVWGVTPRSSQATVRCGFWARIALLTAGTTFVVADAVTSRNPIIFWAMLMALVSGVYYVYHSIHLLNKAERHFDGLRNAVTAARIAACWHRTSDYPGGHRKLFAHKAYIDRVYRGDAEPQQG